MKIYEAIVLVLAPLGTGLAAFDYAAGSITLAVVAKDISLAPVTPCPDAGQPHASKKECAPIVPVEAKHRTSLAAKQL